MIEIAGDPPRIADPDTLTQCALRAAGAYKTIEMQDCARFAAGVHPCAVDYLEQAPVLTVAVMAGGGKLAGGRGNRAYAAFKFGGLCARGAKLRDVMAAYALPVPMRKIAAGALSLDYEDALIGLGRVAPSTLSQIIPSAVSRQRKWLRAYQAFRDRLRHSCTDPNAHATWAATRIAEHRVSWGAAADVADFVAMGDQPINPAWSWGRAEQAARDWHDRLSAGDANRKFGVMAGQIVDTGSHPDHFVVDGFEFVALRTPMAIHTEGRYMRHCVSSYVSYVINGVASIVSVQRDEERIATLELRKGRIAQLKGRFNSAPAADTRAAAEKYVATLRLAEDLQRHVGGAL
jgi:hypothetical protein